MPIYKEVTSAQKPRKYPYKILRMTVEQLESYKFEYMVYGENGRRLGPGRQDHKRDAIACFIMKGNGNYLFKILNLYSRVDLIGIHRPHANPYAIGLLDGVNISQQDIKDNPNIVKWFLHNSWL